MSYNDNNDEDRDNKQENMMRDKTREDKCKVN